MPHQPILEHIPSLRRYARALTGDAWAADDLVQDTLERACSKWRLWLVGSNLRAWLFTLMHNLYANQVRRATRQSRSGREVDIDGLADELAAPPDSPDLALDLQRCLMRLPPEQRAVLLLVALEDLSYAAVAEVLRIPIGSVMSRLSRARARLRELMEAPPASAAQAPQPAARAQDGTPLLRRLK